MHSIVTTFRGAVIKVEVASFCAAMDTLIDQDDVIYANRGCYKLIETIFDLRESVGFMRSRCILFLELHLSIIPQRVQSAMSVTQCKVQLVQH